MRLLLDTHVLVWWQLFDPRLAPVHDLVLGSPAVYVSAATAWEIALKAGSLGLGSLGPVLAEHHFEELPITIAHAEAAAALPRIHADPVDRLLVAQAAIEHLTLVTHDARLLEYGGRVLKV